VAFATETVYGLGVDACNTAAVERLFAAKGRPADNPLIVHVAKPEDWPRVARTMTDSGAAFLEAFSPGPLTVVLPKLPSISPLVTAGLDTVGIRIPDCLQAQELLQAVGKPIAAPSANRSGKPSCTTWQAVLEDLDGRIDAVLKGTVSAVGLESTVVNCCGPVPVLLRAGAISLADLQDVVPGTIAIDPSLLHAGQPLASPGLRHPHYQPAARVQLVEFPSEIDLNEIHVHAITPLDLFSVERSLFDATLVRAQRQPVGECRIHSAAYAGLAPHPWPQQLTLHAAYESVEQYAANFYEFLRQADRLGVEVIFLQRVGESGIGQALRDRQQRAAGTT
jgi:L-threonylcarbamoyladenylate synthase